MFFFEKKLYIFIIIFILYYIIIKYLYTHITDKIRYLVF